MRQVARTVTVTFALAPLVGVLACASGGLPDEPVFRDDYALKQRVFELKSGMRVIVEEDHNTEQVMVRFRVGSGGNMDPPGKEGIAHLIEHLAFRNRPGGGAVELWDLQERMGAIRNAFTNQDVTEFYAVVDKARLSDLMQLEAWRLSHTLDGVTEDTFRIEREVVRNERRQRYETTSLNVPLEVFEQLFPKDHILRRSTVIGSHESLGAIALADVQAFVKQNYTPDNITLVVAGNVNPDDVQKQLGRWPPELLFGPGGPNGAAVPPRPRVSTLARTSVPNPPDTNLRRVVAPVLQPQLVIAWSAPGGLRGDDQDSVMEFASDALNRALDFGIEFKPKDDIESVGALAIPMKDATVFMILASLRPDADPEKQRVRILDAVSNAWAGDLADFDSFFTRFGKWLSATSILVGSNDFERSGGDVLDHYWETGDPAAYKAALESITRVQSTAVKQIIYDYLQRKRAVSVFFQPEADVAKDDKAQGERDQQLAGSRNFGAHRLGKKADISLAGLDSDAILRIAHSPELGKLPRFQLANGLRFVLVPMKNAPVAEIRLRLPGGNAGTEPFGLASFARALSSTDCRDHGNLLPVGGSLFPMGGAFATTYRGTVLDGNLGNGLAVLADQVTCRVAREDAHLQANQPLEEAQERLDRLRKRAQVQAQERFGRELFPDHPYGRSSEPKELAKVPFAAIDGFVKSHYRPDGGLAVVIGDVDIARIKPMAEKYFGSWQRGGGATGAIRPPSAPSARKVLLFDRPGATQSSFQFGCRLTAVTPDSFPAHELVGEILSENLSVLRESWGATYGVYGRTQVFPDGVATLVAGGAIETPKTVEALKKLFAIIAATATDGPEVRPFTLKRWDAAVQWNHHLASGEALAGLLLDAETYGFSPDAWDRYPEHLAQVTRAQIADIVKPCVGKEIIAILGDRRVLQPELVDAGLTPTE